MFVFIESPLALRVLWAIILIGGQKVALPLKVLRKCLTFNSILAILDYESGSEIPSASERP